MSIYNEVFNHVWGDKKSYFGDEFSQKDISVFTEALTAGAKWAEKAGSLIESNFYSKNKRFLINDCKNYIYRNVDFKSMRPSGIIEGSLFSMFLPMIINWIVNKIIEYLLNKYK